jgi:hypothetical protein
MNQLACQYATIRFLPYAETGEFANVGVVLACPATGYLDARLMPTRKTGRIAGFFEQLDTRIYREAMKYLGVELDRVRDLVQERTGHEGTGIVQQMFAGLTRPREALLRFGDTRVVLADDPEATLDQLFARFVERDFADKPYHDKLLERNVRDVLIRAELRQHFDPKDVGNDFVHVRFPFVHLRGSRPAAAIKPLNLAKEDSNGVFDLGGHWLEHVRRLSKHNLLPETLFAVRKPEAKAGKALQAADEIISELREQGVVVAAASDATAIIQFARAALH